MTTKMIITVVTTQFDYWNFLLRISQVVIALDRSIYMHAY